LAAALDGIKVLDLTRVLAGPWASQLLADFGADVIKVERPGVGDDTRKWGPPFLADDAGQPTAESAYFCSANRNKRSITINLASRHGQSIVKDLVARSDVVIENYKVGTLQRYGLDYESLATINPGIVYCSISAFGQSGSRAAEPGYDAMIQATAGLMSITGEPDEDGGSPQKVGVAISDIMAGMYASNAILAALLARGRGLGGQYIDLALFDSQVAWLANQNMNYLVSGETPRRLGTGHPNLVPYQAFETADGFIMLAVGNDEQFSRCARLLGHAEWVTDRRFSSNAARVSHRSELIREMQSVFATQGSREWLEAFRQHVIPAGPINTIAEVFESEYASEKSLVRPMQHSIGKVVPTVANPVKFSSTPVSYRRAPPLLGEHTEEILVELGYGPDRIAALRAADAI